MKKLSIIITVLFFIFLPVAARANSIAVSSVAFGAQNTSSHYMPITFNLTWANSWKDATNYDAAWVFIKYSLDGGVTWNHATLGPISGGSATTGSGGTANPTNFSGGTATVGGTGTSLDVIVPSDNKGAFVQIASASTGSGTLSSTSVQFLWNYSTDIGTSSANDNSAALAIVQVMAIEMVYIPTGSFYVGDGTSTTVTGQFCAAASHTTPFQITSQGALTLGGGGAGSLGDNNDSGMNTADDFTDASSKSLPSTFPEGYNAYYMMKYDVSQGQYRDFLNTLTRAQQATRVATNVAAGQTTITNVFVMNNTSTVSNRNGIRVISPIPSAGPVTFGCDLGNTGTLNGASDGEWIAANFLSWMDGAAYGAWAGLRPFTELEYEKAARGPSSADTGTNGEYAWGSTTITGATSISNSGQNSEVAGQTGNGLCVYNNAGSVQGPMRVGMAAASSTTRAQAGASYWGILDLSGNVWKRPVTVGNTTGRAFLGSNGTGVLASDGNATNADWPGYSAGEVSGATGCGLRGGDWFDGSTYERVSDRYDAAFVYTGRRYNYGARFARTSP